jgi:hypothetical protein
VDWDALFFQRSELFAPIANAARCFARCASFPTPEEIDAALSASAGVRFVVQRPKPRRYKTSSDPSALYDAQIVDGRVPTRMGSWHDLMNALVWASFPLAKRALHAKQHALVVANGVGAPCRTPELDALAMIDEGGIVVVEGKGLVFGHGIYEGLIRGWETPVGKAIVVEGVDPDAGLARVIERGQYMTHVRMSLESVRLRASERSS